MCNDHSGVPVRVLKPHRFGAPGEERWTTKGTKGIDRCIAPLVEALNNTGFGTVASCCGHGHRPGNIALEDGREIIIAPDYDTARRIDALFPVTSYGELRSC